MCMQHNVVLYFLCKWKRPKRLFFVVKRYAVRKAKKWRYAVRKAKIGRYARGEGGCHPHTYEKDLVKQICFLKHAMGSVCDGLGAFKTNIVTRQSSPESVSLEMHLTVSVRH